MQVKPSFFSVAGFLVPGVLFLATLSLILGPLYVQDIKALSDGIAALVPGTATAAVVATLVLAIALALAYFVGAVLSDAFTFACRQLVIRRLCRPRLRAKVRGLFAHRTLSDLVQRNMDAREAYVYLSAGGLDLGWYAGRVRMMGASGLAILICGAVSAIANLSCTLTVGFIVVGAIALVVAGYRSNKFDEYVAATAAVLVHGTAHIATRASDLE